MQEHTIVVRALWDRQARVWVATGDDVPGLVTEAGTQQGLVKKLHVMIPDLLEDESGAAGDLTEVPVMIVWEQLEKVRLRA